MSSIGSLSLQLEEVELTILVQNVIARFRPLLAHAKCEVACRFEPSLLGQWDPRCLEQVVLNLLSNAAKFGAGKPIEVCTERFESHARLSVRDHGIGIDASSQSRIFNQFEQVAPSVRYGGLGRGLYICRGIVEAHGGTIRVGSQPGSGATFFVELPLAITADRHCSD